ncbi:NADPH-dependent 2,4-dienoyl-CoA reductase/sulfur reductase-like enzyme [Spinactinospora alkalitolerans]|uniref:NADPH-dependent 2,4-dienoyl-CoA reductase/sulfur reductase-like enzyme n=1 Tax=Spinactinospora alkalitolerans TaxID=687207 RepID=A0A852TYX4_9ACTN|nr:FAD-dependent oxidoreductase [Spinactinospora alkalitolerans]NYE48202.1 NADPH-dependent 2,4-dienoyl-CoA reductase/sulfur reductase-like enzyme [Spinactinospora alkalitolerans]
MSADTIVIVGGGLSGLRTAEKLRRLGHEGPVTLVGAESRLPYDRPPLSKTLLTQEAEPAEAALLRPAERYAELGIDVRTSARAVSLDAENRRVALDTGESIAFDRLVIATGVRARTIGAFGSLGGVHTLRTWEDCLALRAATRSAAHLTVVGAGVLGCEVAASARALGLDVALVESLGQPLARVLGAAVGESVASLHRDAGVRLHCAAGVTSAEGEERVERVVLTDGGAIDTDAVVVAVGSVPDTEWLEGSGIALDDGVLCDRTGRTSIEEVFAVGDVARMPHPHGNGTVRFEHWSGAGDTASLVAANLLADPADRRPLSEVPYFWSDQYGARIQCLGTPDPDDALTVVDGALEAGRFLALYSGDGLVTGAVAIGMPAALARCRTGVGARTPLAELVALAPWERARPLAGTRSTETGKA